MMVSVNAVSRRGSVVSRGKCRGRGVEDPGGMHRGEETIILNKRKVLDSSGSLVEGGEDDDQL